MTIHPKKCIYCLGENQDHFKGVEHVIPQSFGKYGTETPTLNCVCDDCNSFFGSELDLVLARDTLEGISRYKHGLFSKKRRPQKRLRIKFGEGSSTGDFAGAAINIDPTTNKLTPPLSQFQAFNYITNKFDVFLDYEIKGLVLPEKIYGKPGKKGEKGNWNTKIYAPSKEDGEELIEKLHKEGIAFIPGDKFKYQADEFKNNEQKIPVVIEDELDSLHKRALAKIFLNFIAKYIGKHEALLTRWDFLRRYVRYGKGNIKARLSNDPFWTGQETATRRFKGNGINIRIENRNGNIVGVIQ